MFPAALTKKTRSCCALSTATASAPFQMPHLRTRDERRARGRDRGRPGRPLRDDGLRELHEVGHRSRFVVTRDGIPAVVPAGLQDVDFVVAVGAVLDSRTGDRRRDGRRGLARSDARTCTTAGRRDCPARRRRRDRRATPCRRSEFGSCGTVPVAESPVPTQSAPSGPKRGRQPEWRPVVNGSPVTMSCRASTDAPSGVSVNRTTRTSVAAPDDDAMHTNTYPVVAKRRVDREPEHAGVASRRRRRRAPSRVAPARRRCDRGDRHVRSRASCRSGGSRCPRDDRARTRPS